MSTTDIAEKGSPNLRAVLNNSGSNGDFTVYDGSITVLTVKTGGTVVVYGPVERAGTQELSNTTNTNPVDMLYLRSWSTLLSQPVKRIEFQHDGSALFERIKATGGGQALRMEADTIQLNTGNSTGTIASFLTNGTSRVTVEYNSARVEVKSGSTVRISSTTATDVFASGATADLSLLSGRNSYWKLGADISGDGSLLITDKSGDALLTIREDGRVKFSQGGVDYGFYEATDGGGDTSTTTLEVGEDSSRGRVRLRADTTAPTKQPGVLTFEPPDVAAGTDLYLYVRYVAGTPAKLKLCAAVSDPGSGSGSNEVVLYTGDL